MSLTQVTKAGLHDIALDHVFTIGASGSSAYTFQGEGLNGTVNNPTLYLTRGKTYRFENGSGGHPIRIQSTAGASGTAYNTGVTNNAGSGTVIVEVQHDAPDVLYYQCTSHAAMNGILYITGALPDGGVTTAKIADANVTRTKIAASAVSTSELGDAGVTTAKIANGSITTTKIADDQITTAKINDDAVTSAKIADDAVVRAAINANAVSTSKIENNAVTTAKIADQAVDLTKLPHGTSSNDGKFLRANNGADPSFESLPAGTTINNNADNRVITGSGTANTLEGEANFTFDGTDVAIPEGLVHAGDTDTKIKFTDNQVVITTAGSTRFEVQDDGDILLNDEISTVGSTNAIRTNIPSTRAFGSTSNRNTKGKITIRAGDADNTNIDDDNCAIKIYPAGNRGGSGAVAYGGIAWNHLDPEVYNPSVYNGSTCWMGPTVHDLAGQERDNFEIRMNSQSGTGTQPDKVGFRLSPEGYQSLPNSPMFIGEGTNYSQSTSNFTTVVPHYELRRVGITRSGGEFTVPESGIYAFNISALWHPGGENIYYTQTLQVNGSQAGDMIQGGQTQTQHGHFNYFQLVNISSGDTIRFLFKASAGGVYGGQANWSIFKIA